MTDLLQLVSRRTGALDRLPDNFHTLSGTRKVDAILDLDDAAALVSSLSPDDAYHLIADIGANDCTELLALTSTEQRQAFLDIDCWRRDTLDLERFDEWLDYLAAAGVETLIDTVDHLDPELLVDYILSHVHVVLDRTEEKDIQAFESWDSLQTPDLDFVLVLVPGIEDDGVSRLKRLVDLLYRIDLEFARALMFSSRSGLRLENEELAYRFRAGRMADLGFPPADEAHTLYAAIPLDGLRRALAEQRPRRATDQAEGRLDWALVRSVRREGSFLTRAAMYLERPDAFAEDFAFTVNRAMATSADGVLLRDARLFQDVAAAVHSTVSLGLEYLSEGDERTGGEILDRAFCVQLFQAGHGLAVRRAVRARSLRKRAPRMFGADVEHLLDGLLRTPQPMRPAGALHAPFETTAQLDAVDAILDQATAVAEFFENQLGLTRGRFEAHEFAGLSEDDRLFVDFSLLARTLLAHRLAGAEASFEPLTIEALQMARARLSEVTGLARTLAGQLGGGAAIDILAVAAASLTEGLAPLRPGEAADLGTLSGVVLLSQPA